MRAPHEAGRFATLDGSLAALRPFVASLAPTVDARWTRHRIAMLAVTALLLWGVKRHYADADVGQLRWILQPVAALSALAGRTSFDWEPGAGYLSREKLLVIAKPCAGVNFMLAALGMTAFLLSERANSYRNVLRFTVLAASIAYFATVIANTARIAIALWLSSHPVTTAFWTAARVHRLEGVVVYFVMLALLHQAVRWLLATKRGDAFALWLPLAAYYAVTIGIPLANGAGSVNRSFLEHVIVVVLVPPTLVGFFALARHAARRASVAFAPR